MEMTEDIITNDQISTGGRIQAFDHRISQRLGDEAYRMSQTSSNSTQNIRTAGYMDGTRAQSSSSSSASRAPTLFRRSIALRQQLPFLQAVLPQGINTTVVLDRTTTIRASVKDVETNTDWLGHAGSVSGLSFLRSPRATLIPTVAVPVSLIGTFAVMYMLDYSLDNLSLMAFTIATGFVVDDAIVVMENITRHIESGMDAFCAALQGAKEIGFTVFSISMSLIAVFIPIMMMGGIVGRLFREFAMTLSTAIVVSMVISLTTTPGHVRSPA